MFHDDDEWAVQNNGVLLLRFLFFCVKLKMSWFRTTTKNILDKNLAHICLMLSQKGRGANR